MQSSYKKLFNDTIFFKVLLLTITNVWVLCLALDNTGSGGGKDDNLNTIHITFIIVVEYHLF